MSTQKTAQQYQKHFTQLAHKASAKSEVNIKRHEEHLKKINEEKEAELMKKESDGE